MNIQHRTARRYHWFSDHVNNFVVEPQEATVCDTINNSVLNMVANESEGSRKISVDLVNEGSKRIRRIVLSLKPKNQTTLDKWTKQNIFEGNYNIDFLYMPWNINWKALEKAYEFHPKNYEELLNVKGIGQSTIRGLAFVSEIIYGQSPSWKDPVKFSFGYGGKDGVPFPVDSKSMDESIQFLREAVEQAKIGNKQKLLALNKLRMMILDDD